MDNEIISLQSMFQVANLPALFLPGERLAWSTNVLAHGPHADVAHYGLLLCYVSHTPSGIGQQLLAIQMSF